MKAIRWKALAKEWAFTTLAGIIAHFALYSNWLTNPDGMAVFGEYYANAWETSLGRFVFPIIDILRDGMGAPALNAFFAIALFAAAAVMINEIFDIKSQLLRYCGAIAIISSPVIANLISYYFMAVAYGISALMTVLSVLLIVKKRRLVYILISAVFLMLSLGIYQSCLGLAAGLCLFALVLDVFKCADSLRNVGKALLRMLAYGALGIGMYYGVMNLVLKAKGLTLANYSGLGSLGLQETISNLLPGIHQAYSDFAEYFFGNFIKLMVNSYFVRESNIALAALLVLSLIIIVVRYRRNFLHIIVGLFLLALTPIACNCTVLIAVGTSIILRTAWGMLAVVPFVAAMISQSVGCLVENSKIWSFPNLLKYATCIVCIVLIVGNMSIDHMDALVMKTSENKFVHLANRICADIEKNEYYQNGGRFAIIGVPKMGNYPLEAVPAYAGYDSIYDKTNYYSHWELVWWDGGNMNYQCWKRIFMYKLGLNMNWCEYGELESIAHTEEFAAMANYPYEGSISIINDVLVIKISD